jgi:hypothetical protein
MAIEENGTLVAIYPFTGIIHTDCHNCKTNIFGQEAYVAYYRLAPAYPHTYRTSVFCPACNNAYSVLGKILGEKIFSK